MATNDFTTGDKVRIPLRFVDGDTGMVPGEVVDKPAKAEDDEYTTWVKEVRYGSVVGIPKSYVERVED